MEGRREVSIVLHRSVTNRFEAKRPVFRWSVSTCLQLVVVVNDVLHHRIRKPPFSSVHM